MADNIREKIADVYAEINGDTSGVKKAVDQSEGMLKGLDKRAKQILAGVAGYFAFSKIKGVISDGVAASIDQDRVTRQFDMVFGKAAERVKDSLSGQDLFGSTQGDVMEAMTRQARMARAFGVTGDEVEAVSRKIVRLAGDLSSFEEGSLTETNESMESFMRGMLRAGYQVGVFTSNEEIMARAMKMTGKRVKEQIVEVDLYRARLSLLEEAVKRQGAIGHYADNTDSIANSTKRIKSAWDETKESIGYAFRELVDYGGIMRGIVNVAETVRDVIGEWSQSGKLLAVSEAARSTMLQIGLGINTVFQMAGTGLGAFAADVVTTFQWMGENWDAAWKRYFARIKGGWVGVKAYMEAGAEWAGGKIGSMFTGEKSETFDEALKRNLLERRSILEEVFKIEDDAYRQMTVENPRQLSGMDTINAKLEDIVTRYNEAMEKFNSESAARVSSYVDRQTGASKKLAAEVMDSEAEKQDAIKKTLDLQFVSAAEFVKTAQKYALGKEGSAGASTPRADKTEGLLAKAVNALERIDRNLPMLKQAPVLG